MLASPIGQSLDAVLPAGGALCGRLFGRLLGSDGDDTPLAAGTRIGCWRLDRLLGCGGSSMVYLADRADGHFEQQVALKIVRPNPAFAEQFRRERQVLAHLRHPAIARLIDGGEIDDGRLWFAMEAVFGERIDHHVRNHALGIHDRLALFEEVCEVVAYAHERRLVHRDIKPGNLLVDDAGKPRLLDFGIAMTDGAGDDGDFRAMTPIYASPEQRAGGIVTTASDIYQLGMLLRALVMPDDAPCTAPISPLAGTLRSIIGRATAFEPAHRFPTVVALHAEVAAMCRRRTRSRTPTAEPFAGSALRQLISQRAGTAGRVCCEWRLPAVTSTETGCEAIPLATTTRSLAPDSIPGGTSNVVVTTRSPVATPIEL
ncbi:MAG TPA: serine/threonine-protein kinase [Rhodanobacteraceae bacterium]|jgi:serine/threonine-protein kinase|nr:serine/threonine-protein kinase [Rhodanobacteraceae bacterium]